MGTLGVLEGSSGGYNQYTLHKCGLPRKKIYYLKTMKTRSYKVYSKQKPTQVDESSQMLIQPASSVICYC